MFIFRGDEYCAHVHRTERDNNRRVGKSYAAAAAAGTGRKHRVNLHLYDRNAKSGRPRDRCRAERSFFIVFGVWDLSVNFRRKREPKDAFIRLSDRFVSNTFGAHRIVWEPGGPGKTTVVAVFSVDKQKEPRNFFFPLKNLLRSTCDNANFFPRQSQIPVHSTRNSSEAKIIAPYATPPKSVTTSVACTTARSALYVSGIDHVAEDDKRGD